MRFKKTWHDFIHFLRLIKKDHANIIWIMIPGALAGAAQPFVQLVFYSKILDLVLGKRYEDSVLYVVILLSSTLVLNLISQACKQAIEVLRNACNDTIYLRTADKAFSMEYEEFEKMETMDAVRRVRGGENGSGGIGNQIQSIYNMAEHAFATLFSFVFVVNLLLQVNAGNGIVGLSSWSILGILVVFGVVMMVCLRISAASYKYYYEVSKKNEHVNSLSMYLISLFTNYQNGKDIRIYFMQGLIGKHMRELMKKVSGIYLKWGITDGYYTGIIMMLTQLASGLVYIVIGINAINGIISIGDVLMYAGAVLQLTESVRSGITEFNSYTYRMEYLNTYYEFINRPNTHYTGTLPVEKRSDADYEFVFEHVSFQYPGTKELVLKDIDLKFKVGEKFAVVGRNGAGKTTLIKLLCRLYEPTQGRILLNGIDIKYYDYSEYTRIFSVVFQDFKLLSLPLGDNIAAGEEVEEERMWQVLAQAGLKKRVEAMPEGLRSRLYRNNGDGVEVSGGEAQKLAIARALYKDGPFVILDEPTAALDPLAEAEIYEQFNDMIHGKTAIYISHRMSSCKFCDDILVLDGGRIAERGDHTKLLKNNGIYAALYQKQAQYYTA